MRPQSYFEKISESFAIRKAHGITANRRAEELIQCIRRPSELPGIVLIHEPGDLEIVVAAQGFQLLGHPPTAVLWVVLV